MQVFGKQGESQLIQETQQGPHQALLPAGAGWEAVVDPGSLPPFVLSSCSRPKFWDSAPRLPVLHCVLCYLVDAWCSYERVPAAPGP